MKIWFDMDGTIADLYGVQGWLDMLIAEDATPYAIAKPLVNLNVLAKLMHKAQRNGYEICIVTALSKNSTPEYDEKVKTAKERWLKKHLASVEFDEIRFVPYTFTKNDVNSGNDILFDDEERHLNAWKGLAINAHEIIATLKMMF
jgi:5'(3')-deoxyribonucleotidase